MTPERLRQLRAYHLHDLSSREVRERMLTKAAPMPPQRPDAAPSPTAGGRHEPPSLLPAAAA